MLRGEEQDLKRKKKEKLKILKLIEDNQEIGEQTLQSKHSAERQELKQRVLNDNKW